jgi:hypothetical protein
VLSLYSKAGGGDLFIYTHVSLKTYCMGCTRPRWIRRKAAEKLELDDERLRLELLSFAPAQLESTAQMSLSKVGQQNITT